MHIYFNIILRRKYTPTISSSSLKYFLILGKSLFFLANPFSSFPLSQFHPDSCKHSGAVTAFPLLFLPGFPVWSLILKWVSRCNCDANKGCILHKAIKGKSNIWKYFYLPESIMDTKKKWTYFCYNQLGGNPFKKMWCPFLF